MKHENHPPMVYPPLDAVPVRPYDYYDFEERRKINLWDYWQTLVRRKWWVIGFFLGIVFVVGLVTALMTPIYRATTLVQITSDDPGSLIRQGAGSPLYRWGERLEFYQTQFQILKSQSLAKRVVERLSLVDHPEFESLPKVDPNGQPIPRQQLERSVTGAFMSRLEVTPQKDSFLVYLSFDAEHPELAQQVANTVAQEYMHFGMESRAQAFSLVKQWLNQQLQGLRAKVEASEEKLHQFGKESNIVGLEGQENVVVQKFTDLSALLTKAESERMAKEAQYRQIEEKGVDAPIILNSDTTQNLRQQVAEQEAQVASMSQIYLPGHPQMQAESAKLGGLRSRLNQEVQRIRKSVKADYEAANRSEDLLRQALKDQKEQVATLKQQAVKYKILKRDVETNEELYQGLLSRMKEASIASTVVPTNVQVIDPAQIPGSPYRPNKKLNLALASVIGLFGGIGLAFLVESLDSSIKTTKEWEQVSQLPVLGQVPLINGNRGSVQEPRELGLVIHQQPKSEISEAIRHLRTSILLSHPGGPPGVILVTSPNPGEGKTTLAVNLATSLALQGRKVVLIDADLRKPDIHRIFHQDYRPGLSDLLAGNDTSAIQVLRLTEIPNLFLVPGGTILESPTELLSSEMFKEYLKHLQKDFHHIILDSSPILGFADGLIVSSQADGVLLVIKHHFTPLEAGRLARELLQQVRARVIGTVMNNVASGRQGYGHNYYYSKFYKDYYAGKNPPA
ncbi:MAG: GumC family protein [Desulfobacteraceae bacterium]